MATSKKTNQSVTVRSQVAGKALLSIQVTNPRYTAQQVVDGLNAGQLKYSGGQIFEGRLVVAKYQIQDVDDRLQDFRIVA
jgi:hypothetical protein